MIDNDEGSARSEEKKNNTKKSYRGITKIIERLPMCPLVARMRLQHFVA